MHQANPIAGPTRHIAGHWKTSYYRARYYDVKVSQEDEVR